MNAYTKLSDKGQVVVPKALRDMKGWYPGTDLEVIDLGDGVMLRPRRTGKTLTVDEAIAKLRTIYRHEGPPIPTDQLGWNAGIGDEDA